ncbi:MAG: menaquinone biosynthesis protein [Desulfuromonadales bacterium]|nr:menaquinone biosynthesis protein [Desulfuromonadales bacterium]
MIRIGRIEYANCTPVFHALHKLYPASDYQYIVGVPSYLNSLLASCDIDVCPSSSITFSTHADQFLILPDISISSWGAVLSVLLFSSLPIHDLDGKTVLLSSESATSVNLLKILLQIRYGCDCSYQVTDQSDPSDLRGAAALLLIGDAALRASRVLPNMFVYDLGELWSDWTGEPFVFALWLTTRESFKNHGDELKRLSQQLYHAKVYAREHLEHIVQVSPERNWMGAELLLEYWRNNICYDLSEEHLAGLKRYFQLAVEAGLIVRVPEFVFLPTD